MSPPATLCPRGKGAALGQKDQSFQEQAPGLPPGIPGQWFLLTLQNGNNISDPRFLPLRLCLGLGCSGPLRWETLPVPCGDTITG